MFRSWFTRWQRNSSKARSEQRARRTRQRGYKPVLESVEERVVPCTISWNNTNPGTHLWDVATNWDLGRLPRPTDHVCILRTGDYTVRFNGPSDRISRLDAARPLRITGGSLELTTPLSISVIDSTLSLEGGTLTVNGRLFLLGQVTHNGSNLGGTGEVFVLNRYDWLGGGMLGTGRTTISPGATLNIQGASAKALDRRTLENQGNTIWQGTGALVMRNGASISIETGAVFDMRSDGVIARLPEGEQPTITNAGTFRKSAGTGTTIFQDVFFNNTGTVRVETGALVLTGGGTNTGIMEVTATLEHGNRIFTHAPGSRLAGIGTVIFSGGTTNIQSASPAGFYDITGTTRMTGGQVNFTGTVRNLGIQFDISGGEANFNTNATTSNMTLSGGTLSGTGILTVTGTATWSGGTMSGTGRTLIPVGATLSIEGPNEKVLDRVLENRFRATMNGPGRVRMPSARGAFNNEDGGDFVINSGSLEGSGTFSNKWIVRQRTSIGSQVLVRYIQTPEGLTEVEEGRLILAGGGSNGGTFRIRFGATLAFNGGNYALGGTVERSIANGAGIVEFILNNDRTTVTGNYNFPGTTRIVGGAIADFNASATTNSLALNSGTLGGTGTLTVTGTANWTGGTMSGTGTTVVAAGGTLTLSGPAVSPPRVLDRILDSRSDATMSGGGNIRFGDRGVLNNVQATFEIQSGALEGTGIFRNRGTFRKSSTSTARVSVRFDQPAEGVTRVLAGSLVLTAGGSGSGLFAMSSNTDLRFDGGSYTINGTAAQPAEVTVATSASVKFLRGTHTLGVNSRVTGVGRVTFSSQSQTTVAGTYNVGSTILDRASATFTGDASTGSFQFVNGTFTLATANRTFTVGTGGTQIAGGSVTGPGTLITGASFDWSGGIMQGPGTTTIPANTPFTLRTANNKLIEGRTIDNFGNATWRDAGDLVFRRGSVFNNQAGAVFEIQNDRRIYESDPRDAGRFVNRGTFRKSGGDGLTSLEIPFTNEDRVELLRGRLQIGDSVGGAASTGAIRVEEGATLSFAGQQPYMIRGGTLSGAGVLNVSGRLAWSGGTMTGTGTTTVQAGGTLDLSGPADKTLDGRPLVIQSGGIVLWSGGRILTENDSTITNHAGGTFHVQSGATLRSNIGTESTFENRGTFRKSTVDAITLIQIPFANKSTGIVLVELGTLNLGGNGTNEGVFNISVAAATLTLSSTYSLSGSVTGAGDLRITSPEPDPVAWTFGTWSGTGTTTVANGGVLNIRGELAKTLDRRRVVNHGTINWRDLGRIDVSNGASVENAARFNIFNNAAFRYETGDSFTFDNRGILTKDVTATQVTSFSQRTVFLNSGDVVIDNGVLNLAGTGELQRGNVRGVGTLEITGLIDWTGGAMRQRGETRIAGTGELRIVGPEIKTLVERDLVNGNRVFWRGAGNLSLEGTVRIINNATAEFVLESDAGLEQLSGGPSAFRNLPGAILRKVAGRNVSFLNGGVILDNDGSVIVQSGTLDVRGRFASMEGTQLARGTLEVSGTLAVPSTLKLFGVRIERNAGTIVLAGTGSQIVDQNGIDALLNFSSIDPLGRFVIQTGRTFQPPVIFTNAGRIEVRSGSTFATTQPFLNRGTFELHDSSFLLMGHNVQTSTPAGRFEWYGGTIDGQANFEIADRGTLRIAGGDRKEFRGTQLLVTGTVDTSSVGGVLLGKGSQFQIQSPGRWNIGCLILIIFGGGTITIGDGAIVQKTNACEARIEGGSLSLSRNARLDVDDGTLRLEGGLTNYDAATGTLTGGIYRLTGVLQVPDIDLLKNAAHLTLVRGFGEQLQDLAGNPGLTRLDENRPGSRLDLIRAELVLASRFTNAGIVTLGEFSRLVTKDQFVQVAADPPAQLDLSNGNLYAALGVVLQSGTLTGSGEIYGNVVNEAAIVQVGGNSTGKIIIYGNYTQMADGMLDLQLKTIVEYDQLIVSGGVARLNGTINVSKLLGFGAQPDECFQLVYADGGLILEPPLEIIIEDRKEFYPTYDDGFSLWLCYLGQ